MEICIELRIAQPILVGYLWKRINKKAKEDTGFCCLWVDTLSVPFYQRTRQNQNYFSCRNEVRTELRVFRMILGKIS
jgi:hypothetical protein